MDEARTGGRLAPTGGAGAKVVADRVRAIAAPIIRAVGAELVDVVAAGSGSRTIVRVFIDKPGGVNVEDCEHVHISLGHALDVEDPIPHAYTLEVSSPGLDRPFRQPDEFRRIVGKHVKIKLLTPADGAWTVSGRLVGVTEAGVIIQPVVGRKGASRRQGEPATIAWTAIGSAQLQPDFRRKSDAKEPDASRMGAYL